MIFFKKSQRGKNVSRSLENSLQIKQNTLFLQPIFINLKLLFMNHYETVFILNPVLSEDQVKETVKRYEELLASVDAKMINKEDWGLKKLAYPIQHKKSGFYHLFEFQVEGKHIDTLEVAFRQDERVMRYLTVKMDKHAIEWAKKRVERNKAK